MTAPRALDVPVPSWPVVGNFTPVAVFFLAHMAIVQFSLGVITLGPVFEWLGHRDGDMRKIRLARALTKAYYLSFSIGATLGVFAVTTLIGLWGNQIGTLVNRHLPLIFGAFVIFPLLVPPLVLYHNSFGRMRPGAHTALGVYVAVMQTAFMVLIVGLDAYLVTPTATGIPGALATPFYLPDLLHRFVGNISWAALFVAGIAVLRQRGAADEEDAAYHAWAAHVGLRIGAVALLLMPPLGAFNLAVLHDSQAGFFDNLVHGDAAWLMVVQAAMLGAVLVGVNVAVGLESPRDGRSLDGPGRALTALTLAGSTVGLLPGGVLGSGTYGLRYLGITVAVVATGAHLALRTLPRSQRRRVVPAPGAATVLPFATARARWLVTGVGVLAAVLSLYMGFVKSEARGSDAIYGEMTQSDAHGVYDPQGVYP